MKIKSLFNSIIVILIITFLVFVFWLGWEQLQLEENTFGVVYTKTSGWKDTQIKSNDFNWSFEKVIPGNYTIHKFVLNDNNINFKIENTLPSSILYSEFNSINPENFNYSYQLVGTVRFNHNFLVTKVKDGDFTSSTFNDWLNNEIKIIQKSLESYINDHILNDQIKDINSSAYNYILELYPYFSFSDLSIIVNKPDIELYNLVRNRYLENIKAKIVADEKYLVESLNQQNRESLRLDLLKKYGEVFTQYPIMIEYLKIDQNINLDRATLNDFISPQNQN